MHLATASLRSLAQRVPRARVDTGPTPRPRSGAEPARAAGDALPFAVEIWDRADVAVEAVLALTSHRGIGFAAYYAAAREYPDRHLKLRHNNLVLSRWDPR